MWLMLLWLAMIVDHYCLRFDRHVIHVIVVSYNCRPLYCLRFGKDVVDVNVVGYDCRPLLSEV